MLRMRREHRDEILAHAREGAPEEICGILGGRSGVVSAVYRGTNIAPSPRVRYEMDPRQQLDIMQELEDKGLHLVAIYHSHPNSQAYPSRTDQELAFYPDSVYVIVSLARPEEPVVRAFQMRDSRVEEVELAIDD